MSTEHSERTDRPEHPSLTRIGAFSDGVFAFAITLLILGIRIPHPADADAGKGLLSLQTHDWRSYFAFVLSFMLIGINWANHRVTWKNFARADHVLVWLNLVFLMIGCALMPIPTAVLGAWLGDASNQVVAAVFYGLAATVGALLFNVVWWYGAYGAKLTSPLLTARIRRAHTIAWAPAPVIGAVLTLIAFFNPPLAVAGFVALVFLYVLPVPRLVALVNQRRRRAHSAHRV